ncbi:MAG: Bro-N domain-containing protein, partial [Thomasclavelia spiroformis]
RIPTRITRRILIMNELMIFKNEEFGQIRTVEIDGKPYFVGKDIANSLGYSNPRDAISRHCKGVVKHDSFKEGGQNISLIPEGDMYRLITHSIFHKKIKKMLQL